MGGSFKALRRKLAYGFAFACIALGLFLIVAYIRGGVYRDVGCALVTFFSALALIGLTNKKEI
jgi:hypothetical protein